MWKNSHLPDVYFNLTPPERNGWLRSEDGLYSIDWEDPEVQKSITTNVLFLLSGCTCKKGCTSARCGCRRKGSFCGPGCRCCNCTNLFSSQPQTVERESSSSDESSEELEEEIITDTDNFMLLNDIL